MKTLVHTFWSIGNKHRQIGFAVAACSVAILLAGCPEEYEPDIDPANFVGAITNPFLPFVPGTTFVYEAATPDGAERVEVYVTYETKEILGVTCTVVRDTMTLDGVLAEDTLDWYAQDTDGNVWYFGEDSKIYEDGVVVSTEGSWEAGVHCAKPGIVMEGNPQIGDSYRQEYSKGIAEDMADVLSLTESVQVPYGSFTNCLKTADYSALEPETPAENKFYAAEVGQVLTLEGDVRVELVSKSAS